MLGLRKTEIKKRNRLRTLSFDGFTTEGEGKGLLAVEESRGCDCSEHTLRAGVALTEYTDLKGNVVEIDSFHLVDGVVFVAANDGLSEEDTEEIYAFAQNGYQCYLDLEAKLPVRQQKIGRRVVCASFRTPAREIYNIFASETQVYAAKKGEEFVKIYEGTLRGACIAGDRYFLALAQGKLVYSAPFEPLILDGSTEESGELLLPSGFGQVVALQEFGGDVYLFLERGIFRVEVSATARNFRCTSVAYKGGQICRNSAVNTGKGILFLALTGVYFFDGREVKEICSSLGVAPADPTLPCAYGRCEDLVLLEYHGGSIGWTSRMRLAVYEDGRYAYKTDVNGNLGGNELCFLSNRIRRFVKSKSGAEYHDAPYFRGKRLDFGSSKTKTLKRLRAKGRGEVVVSLRNGENEREYTLSFVDGEGSVPLLERGKDFQLSLYPTAGSEVESLSVDYYCMEG